MSQLLTETLFSIRDPWIIAEQKRILVEEDDSQFSKFVFQNYGTDHVCTSLVENYCIRFPAKIPTVLSIVGKRRLFEYDTSGDAEKLDKKGGFWKKTGNWFKRVIRGIGDAMYDAKRGMLGDKEADEAEKAYDELMSKYEQTADKSVKKLFDSIKSDYPSFPNIDKDDDVKHAIKVNKLPEDTSAQGVFIHALSRVTIMYDTIVAAVQKGPDDGGITADMANEVIKDLRAALNFHSKKLSAVYKKFETDKPEGEVLDEDDDQIDERVGGGQYHRSGAAADDQEDGKKGSSLDIKAGEDTDATKQNKKQKFEKFLLAAGLGAAAIGLLIKFGVLEMLLRWWFGSDMTGGVPPEITEAIGESQEMGLTSVLLQTNGGKFTAEQLANMTRETFIKEMASAGYLSNDGHPTSALKEMWKLGHGDWKFSETELERTLNLATNHGKKLQDFWGVGKYKGHELLSVVTNKTVGTITKMAVKETAKAGVGIAGSGAAILATGTLVAPWLIGLGLGAAVIGGTSLWLKKKGLKTSRSAAIQELINKLEDVSGPSPAQPDVQTKTPEEASPAAGAPPSPKEVDNVLKDKGLNKIIQKRTKDNEDLKSQIEKLRKNPEEIKDTKPGEKGPEGTAAAIVAAAAASGGDPKTAEASISAAVDSTTASKEQGGEEKGKLSLKSVLGYGYAPEKDRKKMLDSFIDGSAIEIKNSMKTPLDAEQEKKLKNAIIDLLKDRVVETKSSSDDLLIERWNRLAGLKR